MSLHHSPVSIDGLAASSADESCAKSIADGSCADSLASSSSCDGADEKPLECHDVDDVTLGGMSPGSSAGLVGDSDDGGKQTNRQWRPGEGAWGWVGPHAPLNQQAQVLVANIMAAVGALPRQTLRHLASVTTKVGATSAKRVAAWLLGIGKNTISRLMRNLKAHEWVPQEPHPCVPGKVNHTATLSSSTKPAGGLSPEDREQQAMTNLVRMALVNAVEGRSGQEFERDVHRHALAGCVIGDKQRSRHFCREVESIASRVLQ